MLNGTSDLIPSRPSNRGCKTESNHCGGAPGYWLGLHFMTGEGPLASVMLAGVDDFWGVGRRSLQVRRTFFAGKYSTSAATVANARKAKTSR